MYVLMSTTRNSFNNSIVGIKNIQLFFLDAELTSDDNIEQLCYETLRDLFPATDGKTLVLRSKIWKIVSTAKPSSPLVRLYDYYV